MTTTAPELHAIAAAISRVERGTMSAQENALLREGRELADLVAAQARSANALPGLAMAGYIRCHGRDVLCIGYFQRLQQLLGEAGTTTTTGSAA